MKGWMITSAAVAAAMTAMIIAMMAVNGRTEKELKEISAFIAQYETQEFESYKVILDTEETVPKEVKIESTKTSSINADRDADTVSMYVPAQAEAEAVPVIAEEVLLEATEKIEEPEQEYYSVLTPEAGINYYCGVLETYYNLPMQGVIEIMQACGYDYEFWIRTDGVKMYGPYVMVAADFSWMPRGSVLMTSLGLAMVCDTGEGGPYWTDIAVAW